MHVVQLVLPWAFGWGVSKRPPTTWFRSSQTGLTRIAWGRNRQRKVDKGWGVVGEWGHPNSVIIYPFTPSLLFPPFPPPTLHSFTPSPLHRFAPSLLHPFIPALLHHSPDRPPLPTHLHSPSPVHLQSHCSPTHPLTHSPAPPSHPLTHPTHPLTHSPTHPLTQPIH